MVRGVDVDPHGDLRRVGVDRGADGAQGLGQRDRRPAVQEPERLGVALHRHGRHDPVGGDLDQLDAQLVVEASVALGHEGDQLLDAQSGQ